MNGISLCAGVEGIGLGLKLAVPDYRTVCYVEIEPFPQDVLLARMADGVLDRAPIWGDLKRFDANPWRGLVDLVHGGYPCQPFSVAGKQLGTADPRHLWPDIARVVRECEPEWCFFENVAGHLRLGFDVVARDLVDMGYRVATGLFTAEEVGAPHRRQRLFILANAASRDGQELHGRSQEWRQHRGSRNGVGDTDDAGLEGRCESVREGSDEWLAWPPSPAERDQWAGVLAVRPEFAPAVAVSEERKRRQVGGQSQSEYAAWFSSQSAVRRVADGAPRRVDRLKALGNGVVPDVVALAWRTLHQQLTQEAA